MITFYFIVFTIETSNIKASNKVFNDFVYNVTNNQINIIGYKGLGGNVVIPNIIEDLPVVLIAENAFDGQNKITNISFPDTILEIHKKAFANCLQLTSLILPPHITYLGEDIIYKNSIIKTIFIPKTLESFKNKVSPFYGSSIEKIILEDGWTRINDHLMSRLYKLKEVILPNSLLEIGYFAFQACSLLSYIDIPCNVTRICPNAFDSSGLITINLPDNIETIDTWSFKSCTKLISIGLPVNCKTIGRAAFTDCKNLVKINLSNEITSFDQYAFCGCKSLVHFNIPNLIPINNESIYLPRRISRISSYCFCNCSSIKSIITEESLTIINEYAFQNCISLSEIKLFYDVTDIASNSFSNCPKLTMKVIPDSYAEKYSILHKINYTYFYDIASLNIQITSKDDISGMKIVLENSVFHVKTAISLTNNDKIYTFGGLPNGDQYALYLFNKYGEIICSQSSIFLKNKNNSIEIVPPIVYSVNISIINENSKDVTSQANIYWYNQDNIHFSDGQTISQIIKNTNLKYDILLKDQLSIKYHNVKSESIIITENKNISIKLIPLSKINITGQIINISNSPIANAKIFSSQILNNQQLINKITNTNQNGIFSMEIYDLPCKFVISHDFYMSKTMEMNDIIKDIGTIALSDSIGEKILLNFTYYKSVLENEDPIENNDLVYHKLKFDLVNSITKQAIYDFVYQYPYLFLHNYTSLKDPIQINVYNDLNLFKPVSVLTEPFNSNVSFCLIEHGKLKIIIQKSQNAQNIALLYDFKGTCVDSFIILMNNGISSSLSAGEYTVVIIGKSKFFNEIQNLNDLSSAGLINHKDYISKNVYITDGKITTLIFDNVPFFNEEKFYFTDNQQTYFISNRLSAYAGSYFTIKSHVEFKTQYKYKVNNVKLVVNIPENCEFGANSLFADKKIIPYSLFENKIIIPINNHINVIRFCLIPTTKGHFTVNSFIEFEFENRKIIQPLKSAKFESLKMNINVIQKTGKKETRIKGIAMHQSDIYLYDNNVLVGKNTSNENNDWVIDFNLINTSTYSKHYIFAKIYLLNGIIYTTDISILIYNCNYIDVSNITILFGNQKIMYKYPYIDHIISYPVIDDKTHFTFLINFERNDPKIISDVFLIIKKFGSDDILELPALFNQKYKCWITQKTFDINSLPINALVEYNCNDTLIIPSSSINNIVKVSNDTIAQFEKNIKNLGFNIKQVKNTFSSNKNEGELIYEIENIGLASDINKKIITFTIIQMDNDDIDKITKKSNYKRIYDQNGNEFYFRMPKDINFEYDCINVNDHTNTKFSMQSLLIDDENNNDFTNPSIPNIPYNYDGEFPLLSKKTKKEINQMTNKANDVASKAIDILSPIFERPKEILDFTSKFLTFYDNTEELNHYMPLMSTSDYLKANGELMLFYTASVAQHVLSFVDISKITKKYPKSPYTDMINRLFEGVSWITDVFLDDLGQKHLSKAQQRIEKYKSSKNFASSSFEPDFPFAIIDPSGYVYEAVDSNRVEGVTTTVFEKKKKIDIYGEEIEFAELWNAENFGQKNPLISNNLGWYSWDVPKGLWQVKYEKINYETTYSDWLTVPPPQLDVNIPIISYVQPEIKRVTSYESQIEIEFSKYMNTSKLNLDNIFISKSNQIIAGKINLINSENDPNDFNKTYASLIHFIPEINLQVNDEILVFIKKEVISYAGVSMNSDYSQLFKVIKKPIIILDSKDLNITYDNTNKSSFLVSFTPIESVQNKKLLLYSDSPNVVQLDSESFEINNEGNALIPINIKLPGVAHIIITIEGTDIKVEKTINVDISKPKLAPVESSLKSHISLPVNTKVELYSSCRNCIIYFSTNGSVDLNEMQLYNHPISINNDLNLSAIATQEFYENSQPVFFIYSVYHIYTILFDANGGITDVLSKEVKDNDKYGFLQIPIRKFYTFAGWYTELKFENLITNETFVKINKNITLYAKWEPDLFVITFETNGGILINPISLPHGSKINDFEKPTKEGFQFDGWYEDAELTKEAKIEVMPTSNITLYAKWKQNQPKSAKMSTIVIAIIIVAAIVCVAVISLIIYFLVRRKKIQNKNDLP